jgi:hypothetical protein
MTAMELYREATRRGLRLEPRGDKLAVKPRESVTPDFAELLRQHKGELLAWLARLPCPGWQAVPPEDLPLNPVMPRPKPEDRERMIAYMLRQGGGHPSQLAAWLVNRENDYFAGPGAKWDCGLICYAVARDAACWQLGRKESEVLDLLVSFSDAALNRQRGNPRFDCSRQRGVQ